MAKIIRGLNRHQKQADLPKPGQIVINDFGIEALHYSSGRRTLNHWREAYESAISIERPNRALLYDLYRDIMLDDHLTAVTSQRRVAITNVSVVFQNGGKPVRSVNEVIYSNCFGQLLEYALDAHFYGYSLIHADFRNNICELVPRAHVDPVNQLVKKNPFDVEGICYTEGMYPYYYAGVGKPNDLGLLLSATPMVLIKRGNLSDWAQFNEIFGMPMRKGTYDQNMPGQKEQLLKALEMSGAMSYIAIPSGSELEFIDANKSGASRTYDALYTRMEKGLSKLIVGQTMTTEDGSSRSQGQVHERVAEKMARTDRKMVTNVLNGRVREMLIAQGFSEASKGQFQFVDEEGNIRKDERLEMDLSIHGTVAPISKEYFAKEYNVPFED